MRTLHNLLLCHQIKEESVFSGTKTSVEMGNNNLTRDKGIPCPPSTFFFVVQSGKKHECQIKPAYVYVLILSSCKDSP